MELLLQCGILILGFLMLVKGADFFVDGASGIAKRFNIPELVIGLTIVAMGTSLPEASVSITAAIKGSADISIGNVVGSNILNILLILGITSVITAVAVQKSTIKVEMPYMIGITGILLLLGGIDNTVGLVDGILLWVLFIAYLTYLFIMAKKGKNNEEEDGKKQSIIKLIVFTVGGMVLIVLGSNFAVDGATYIAEFFGVSERIIGLTIVAFGTSLPELVTSVTAARKGNADIAIGNIVGSNVFNILFILGITALITPIPFANKFIIDTVFATIVGIVLWLCIFKKNKLTRGAGIIMLILEAFYLVYLFAV